MAKGIFRQKNVDRMNSPEKLNDYIRVTNISVWLLLGAIVILLIGFVLWGTLGTIETKTTVIIDSETGNDVAILVDPDVFQVSQNKYDIGDSIKLQYDDENKTKVEAKVKEFDANYWIIYADGSSEKYYGKGYIVEEFAPMVALFGKE